MSCGPPSPWTPKSLALPSMCLARLDPQASGADRDGTHDSDVFPSAVSSPSAWTPCIPPTRSAICLGGAGTGCFALGLSAASRSRFRDTPAPPGFMEQEAPGGWEASSSSRRPGHWAGGPGKSCRAEGRLMGLGGAEGEDGVPGAVRPHPFLGVCACVCVCMCRSESTQVSRCVFSCVPLCLCACTWLSVFPRVCLHESIRVALCR